MAKDRRKKSTDNITSGLAPKLEFDNPQGSKRSAKKTQKNTAELFSSEMIEKAESRALISAKFSPFNDIYLEIHRGNIFHYFSTGTIAPAKYYERRAFHDTQSHSQNSLVIANGSVSEDSDDRVLFLIELSDRERSKIHFDGSIAYLNYVLPITRIKKILVSNEQIKKTIVSEAVLFSGGFIPEKLVTFNSEVARVVVDPIGDNNSNGFDYSKALHQYDRILGLFAFLRNYHLLVSDKIKTFKTLPDHFIFAMQSIEPKFGSEIIPNHSISDFYSYLFDQNTPSDKYLLKWIFERIGVNENFNDDDIRPFREILLLAEDDEKQDVNFKYILDSLTKSLERKNILSKIEVFKSRSSLPLYLFAFLRNYGNLNSIEVARRDIGNVYSANYGEYAFALLGYFYGYSNLRNSDERTNSANLIVNFLKLNGKKQPIKFQLESNFDHTIIDLVYKKVFGSIDREVINLQGKSEGENILQITENYDLHIQSFKLIDFEYKKIELKSIAKNDISKELVQKIDFREDLAYVPEYIPYLSELGSLCRRLQLKTNISLRGDDLFALSWDEAINRRYYLKSDLVKTLHKSDKTISMEEILLRLNLHKIVTGK